MNRSRFLETILIACIPVAAGRNQPRLLRRDALFAAFLAAIPGVGPAAAEDVLELGRRIYVEGVGESGGEVTAVIGEAGVEVSAAVLPCAGCHGHDGRGKPEGGVAPSNLTWPALTKPYGVDHPGGRSHPPYDDRTLIRAIAMGIDPAGNALQASMPRYRLSRAEGAALVAYIRGLGATGDPGLSDDVVKIGVVEPPRSANPGMAASVRAALEAYAARLNDRGGIYNRRIELDFAEVPAPADQRRETVAVFLEESEVFALASSFLAGAEGELATLFGDNRVPMVGPFTMHPQTGFPLNRYVFYLLSGLAEQARALIDFATVRLGSTPGGPAAVVHMDEEPVRAVVEAALAQGRRQEPGSVWTTMRQTQYEPGSLDVATIVAQEKQAGTAVVLFLGSEIETQHFLEEAERQEWRPNVLLLSPLAGNGAMTARYTFQDKIFLAFASLPTDRTSEAIADYQALASEYSLPAEYLSMQLAAISAAAVLVEGLERAGREVSRENLVEALEGMYGYETGLTPPITFGPNRRVGAPAPMSCRSIRSGGSWQRMGGG